MFNQLNWKASSARLENLSFFKIGFTVKMVESQRNLYDLPYLDKANFEPAKMKLVLATYDS